MNNFGHFAELSDKVQKLCKPRKTDNGTLDNDLCIDDAGLFFCTNVFKDGCFLAFWTHSPWGCVRDGEQGWAVFSPELEILTTCETRTMHQPAGNDFKTWRKEQTETHGKSFKLAPEWGGESFWKITDC